MDYTPIISQVMKLWWIIPILLVIGVLKSPWFKGMTGEGLVRLAARLRLPKDAYHSVHNVTLQTPDGTTQIDHILVSRFGIFVGETKHMKGWIFGAEKDAQWTQKIFRKSFKFQNPLRQNYKHVKALEAALQIPPEAIHSVIVFSGEGAFKTPMPPNVARGGSSGGVPLIRNARRCRMSRSLALLLLLAATSLGAAEAPAEHPEASLGQSTVAALASAGVQGPVLLSLLDLEEAFDTRSEWSLALIQDNAPVYEGRFVRSDVGPLHVCFLRNHAPDCLDNLGNPVPLQLHSDTEPYELKDARIVLADPDATKPLLLLKTCTEWSFNGNCGIETTLYVYDRSQDQFRQIFRNMTGHNNNQITRFVESGPLLGDILVGIPGSDAPFTYWIEVYRQQDGGDYVRVLRYRGKTRYNDGNPLAVVDSEMPEILRRFGLWKEGDPPPVPPRMPDRCTSIYMKGGVEWCR